jgi:hypothetical protein
MPQSPKGEGEFSLFSMLSFAILFFMFPAFVILLIACCVALFNVWDPVHLDIEPLRGS